MRALPAVLLTLISFSFSGCASVANVLPAPLSDVLGQVTGLTGGIANWQSGLGDMLGDTQFGQLKEYADKAGNLGNSIKGMTGDLSQAMADPLGVIGGKLGDMSGIDVDQLKSLAPAAQKDAIKGFADSAGGVSDLAGSFLKDFGN